MLGNLLKRRASEPASAAATPQGSPAPATSPLTSLNDSAKRRQRFLLGGISAVGLLGACWFILGDNEKEAAAKGGGPQVVDIQSGDMFAKNMSQREWLTNASGQLQQQGQSIRNQQTEVSALKEQIATLQAQQSADRNDGQKVIATLSAQNQELQQKLNSGAGAAASVPPPGAARAEPFRVAGAAGAARQHLPPGYDAQGRPVPMGPDAFAPPAEVKIISFAGGAKGQGGSPSASTGGIQIERPDVPATVVEDSPEYLPPNSYAPAKVIVGVDASAGVQSQTDPLPVVLRITGPARSVVNNGRVLTTRISGCVVNGAARGDLSAEKVYVKLAKMTCDQPGGRVAVSEVKGFISFAGKAGVRGRVVSREGNLVGQAALAGLAGGLGRAFTLNTQAALTGGQTIVNGRRQQLGAGEIGQAALGGGVSTAADTVSKYLIERAEQYQPVIEMPTGVDVEIVFLDGVYVRGGLQ